MGLRKPERAAFEAISEAIGTPLSSVLFFDDTLKNVEAARAAGLPAVHVRSPVDVRQALAEIGLL
jgi:putative hydrolase of the HAD superfamily